MNYKNLNDYLEKVGFDINVITGQRIGSFDLEDDYNSFSISVETLRKQLRKEGYYTRIFGCELQFARQKFYNYN